MLHSEDGGSMVIRNVGINTTVS